MMDDTSPGRDGAPRTPETSAATTEDAVARLTPGRRVVVRHRLPEAEQEAGASVTDVLGTLVAVDDTSLVVRTSLGEVTIPRTAVVAAKEVPPPPSRPGPAHQRVSADDLERLMTQAWPPLERAGLGSWVLRSAQGFTGRANSVLPVGDPTLPLDKAIEYVEKWYAERGRPTMVQVHGEPGFSLADHPLAGALLERGYVPGGGRSEWERVLVLTGSAADVPPLTEQSAPVVADSTLTPEWLMAYGQQRSVVPGVTERVLSGPEGILFLSIRDQESGRIIALARMGIHPGWAGIFALWVDPEHRRQGLATTLTSAVAMLGRDNNMPSIYLQVSADNEPARRLYEGMGFTVHHEYTYLVQPQAD